MLALALAVLMTAAVFPVTSAQVTAATENHPDSYTVSVTENGTPVAGAAVTLEGTEEFALNLQAETGDDGVAAFESEAIGSALTDAGLEEAAVTLTVDQEGYDSYEQEITVSASALTENVDVSLTKTAVQTATVSVEVKGDAAVTVNGISQNSATVEQGAVVPVTVTPAKGSYIKELTVDGEPVPVEKGQAYSGEVTADDNVSIRAVVVQEYTVSASVGEGGQVTLNGQQTLSLTVDENSDVPVSVQAEEGYWISSVKIGGVAQDVSADRSKFETSVKITADTEIVVSFVQVFTVTVNYDSEKGAVTTEPEHVGDVVTVEDGAEVTLKADPKDNYRVAKVVIKNGKSEKIEEEKFEENYSSTQVYKKTLEADQNYTIEIIFAPNRYEITLQETKNGTVTTDPSGMVDHGSAYDVTVTPDEEYSVASVTVNGEEITEDFQTDESGKVTFTVSDVAGPQQIEAVFTETEIRKTEVTELFNGNEAVRVTEEDQTYVFARDAKVDFSVNTISTLERPVSGIRLLDAEGKVIGGGKDLASVTISADQAAAPLSIAKIQLWYQADGEMTAMWHDVSDVSAEQPLVIVIDQTGPEIELTPSEKDTDLFYNDDFQVNVSLSEEDDLSGIAKIEYFVTDQEIGQGVVFDQVADALKTQQGMKEWEDEEIPSSGEFFSVPVTVTEDQNNSDFVSVWVRVTDGAGNVTTVRTEDFLVNRTAPKLERVRIFTIDEKTGEEVESIPDTTEAAEGNYNSVRVAQITISDRKSSFDPDKAKNSIQIIAKNAAKEDITLTRDHMISDWVESGADEKGVCMYTATVTFDTDARYIWAVSSETDPDFTYVNKAGLVLDKTAVSESGDDLYGFTVDRQAPETWEMNLDTSNGTMTWTDQNPVTRLLFKIWDKKEISVHATAEDSVSDISGILYYKTDTDSLLTEEELEGLYANGQFTDQPYSVTKDERIVVYARITDLAGNTVYVNTDGAVVDTTASMVTVKALEDPNEHGVYNKDVPVEITVKEQLEGKSAYSGIQSVSYKIVKDAGLESQEEGKAIPLYTFDVTDPAYSDLKEEFSETITVDAAEYNSDHVEVIVTAVDNAGNPCTETLKLAINVDVVKATLSMDGTPNRVEEENGAERGYYDMEAGRKAVITVEDRAFDAEKATAAIQVKAVDVNGEEIENSADAYTVSDWASDGDFHQATVTFLADANYTWSFSGENSVYTNKAGNALNTEATENLTYGNLTVEAGTATPFTFTLDTTPPTGTVKVNDNIWDKILEIITFGLYSRDSAEITAAAEDVTSPVEVAYYKTSDPEALSEEDLKALDDGDGDDKAGFVPYSEAIHITDNEQFVVYFRITDYAGNVTYLSSDGYMVDQEPSEITITPAEANGFYDMEDNDGGQYGLYGADPEKDPAEDVVPVEIHVEDAEPYSGIRTVEYWVECDGEKTQEATLYSAEYVREEGDGTDENGNHMNTNGGTLTVTDWDSETQTNTEPTTLEGQHPLQNELAGSWDGTVEISKAQNNSCNVEVFVKTIDQAGNENEESVKLDIDVTDPTLDISFDNGNGYEYQEEDGSTSTYFDAGRTATIVITERSHHFNAQEATESIHITAEDARGNDVSDANADGIPDAYRITDWTTEENDEDPDAATHTATVEFLADANYTWSVDYADEAGNRTNTEDPDDLKDKVTTGVEDGTCIAPFAFTVDTRSPIGTVKAVSTEGRETVWDETDYPRENLTFGFWSGDRITISGTQDDVTSPIDSVEYYRVSAAEAADGTTPLTAEQLNAVTEWQPFEGLEIAQDEQFTVYLKITDRARNYTYLSTSGLIVDHTRPEVETLAPEITITPQQPVNGIYNGDVDVDIAVTDPLTGGTYSGLKTVTYRVLNMGEETQSGTLYLFKNDDPAQSELQQSWNDRITVDSRLNNSNNVVIEVYAEDNAQNSSEADTSIKIDITDPTIDVSYDNNSADSSKYFNRDRTATIVVTERNFDPEDVRLEITNTDGVIPSLSSWSKTAGTGNEDDTRWTATLTYAADGDYTFDMQYTDQAGNASPGPRYGNSVAPADFTVDKTLPTISVSYSNNNVSNGRYFSAPRTATITVTEHNFDVSRVVFTQTASLGGSPIAIPSAAWSSRGDVHTATISYTNDGDYTFDVTMTDMAGNESGEASYGGSAAARDFVIDQTIEKPVIGGVENGNAYTGDVIPTISFGDTNYASYEITLLRTRMGERDVDVTDQFIHALTEDGQGGSGVYDTFDRIVENDGIYTLTVRLTDLAGNEESETVTFTINRFGSVYEYSDYLASLIRDGGQYITITGDNETAVTEDLVITEYSAEPLLDGSVDILITRDGEAVDAAYTTNPAVINSEVTTGDSGWYQYEYTIATSNFAEDGVYRIALASKYEAADSGVNESTSVPENSIDSAGNPIVDTMSFTVDTTVPEIRNIANLEETIINAQSVDVDYTIVDVGGLASVEVLVDGEPVEDITEFGDNAFNYTDSFTINESNDAQTVRLVATDRAGNVTDTASEDFDPGDLYAFHDTVTVSTNAFVRWYANKTLFWGTIVGIIVVAAGACAIVAVVRRKKENG